MVCFSGPWSNPVIWAHYSDKHRGICLGFEIPEIRGIPEQDESCYVRYIEKPLPFPMDFAERPDGDRYAIVQTILFTKFDHWKYEEEIRVWAPLQNEESGIHYLEFDQKLRLVEVIIGAKCTLSQSAITRALGSLTRQVEVIKARSAYDRFEMVKTEVKSGG